MTSPHPGYRIGTPYRRTGRLWSLGWHTGDDWLTPTGTKAYAMADGTVRSVSRSSAYGLQVVVESTAGGRAVRWSFNHLTSVAVKTGQKVIAGQVIARTGATGNVTGPHNHVEARKAPFTFAAANFLDPDVLYKWVKPRLRPAWATLRPKKAPRRWYRVVGQNLGGLNTHGRATYRTRYPKIVADVDELRPEVVCFQELANGQVEFMSGLMKVIGYKRASGRDGRHIYVRNDVHVKRAGVFELYPRYKGDDKQAAWVVAEVNGHDTLVTNGHLEHEDGADDERVEQALSQIDQADELAKELGLPPSRVVHVTDTNSDAWVRVRAFNERKFVDAAETAWHYSGLALATFKGWASSIAKGARIDTINVYRTRPVLFYGTRKKGAKSERDHLMIIADIGLITD